MQIREITLDVVKSYINVDHDIDDILIQLFMDDAKSNIMSYTDLSEFELDIEDGLAIVYLCLIADMYENRGMTTNTNNVNEVITKILNLHDCNW